MTSNQRLTVTLSVLLSVVTAFILGYALAYKEDVPLRERVLTECESIGVGEFHSPDEDMVGDDVAGILYSSGWRGNPADKQDRLYSPACIFH